jgi:hypothetical protein
MQPQLHNTNPHLKNYLFTMLQLPTRPHKYYIKIQLIKYTT